MDKPIETWHVEKITLWYNPSKEYDDSGDNEGFSKALSLLQTAALKHPDNVKLVDTSLMSPEEISDVYLNHASTCSWWKYKVRRVFGTGSEPGWLTGNHVPLIAILFKEFKLPMIAPYDDWQFPHKPTRTILSVLQMLSSTEQLRLFGQIE